MRKLPVGTQIECVAHDGAHKGKIVHDLGFAYAVAWPFRNVDVEASKAHADDFAFTDYDKVREA